MFLWTFNSPEDTKDEKAVLFLSGNTLLLLELTALLLHAMASSTSYVHPGAG